MSLIRQVPFFADASDEVARQLISVLRPQIFMPNEYIIRAGEVGTALYLLNHGSTEVVSITGVTLTQLGPGKGGGRESQKMKRNAVVVAPVYLFLFSSSLFILSPFLSFSLRYLLNHGSTEVVSTTGVTLTQLGSGTR